MLLWKLFAREMWNINFFILPLWQFCQKGAVSLQGEFWRQINYIDILGYGC